MAVQYTGWCYAVQYSIVQGTVTSTVRYQSRTLALAVAGAAVRRFQFQGLMAGDHIIHGIVKNRGLWVSNVR